MNLTKTNFQKGLHAALLGVSSALLIGCFPLSAAADEAIIAEGECGADITYTISSDYTLYISGNGEMDCYSSLMDIPEEGTREDACNIDTIVTTPWYEYTDSIKKIVVSEGITSIGDYAFFGIKNVSSVALPNSVEEIRDYAFYGCELEEISFPENLLAIGSYTFCYNNFTSITFPDSLQQIGKGALSGTSLKSVVFPESLQQIGPSAFEYCDNLRDVYINDALLNLPTNLFAKDYTSDYASKHLKISLPCTLMRYAGYDTDADFLEAYYPRNKDKVTIRHQPSKKTKFYWSNSGLTCQYGSKCTISKSHSSLSPCEVSKTVTQRASTKKEGFITCTATYGELSETKEFTLPAIDKFELLNKKYILKDSNLSIYPSFKLTDKKGNEIAADYYTVSIDNTDEYGDANMKLTLKDCYKGTFTAKYKIVPRSAKIFSYSTGKKSKLYLSWDYRNHPKIIGYQVQISTQKDFKDKNLIKSKNLKYKKSKPYASSQYTFTNLAKGSYYPRVRVYGLDKNKKKVYSKWESLSTPCKVK